MERFFTVVILPLDNINLNHTQQIITTVEKLMKPYDVNLSQTSLDADNVVECECLKFRYTDEWYNCQECVDGYKPPTFNKEGRWSSYRIGGNYNGMINPNDYNGMLSLSRVDFQHEDFDEQISLEENILPCRVIIEELDKARFMPWGPRALITAAGQWIEESDPEMPTGPRIFNPAWEGRLYQLLNKHWHHIAVGVECEV